MTGTLNDGTELFEKNVIIDRDILKSLEGENTGTVAFDGQDSTENMVEDTQTDKKEQEEVEPIATPEPTATPEPESSALEVDTKTIKSVQSILNAWGYNCGTPDMLCTCPGGD